jgi:hypothetical protein
VDATDTMAVARKLAVVLESVVVEETQVSTSIV